MVTSAIFLCFLFLAPDAEEGISNLPASVSSAPLRVPQPAQGVQKTSFEQEPTDSPPRPLADESAKAAVEQGNNADQSEQPRSATENADEAAGRKITPRSERSRFSRRITEKGAGEEKEDGEGEATSPSSRRSTWWITTAVGLIIVLAVIYGGGRALRSFLPGMSVNESTGPIQVLYRTFLSPKQVACLVRCGDRLLLVGLSGDRMQTLAEIRDPTEIDYIKGQCQAVRPRSTTKAFRDMFRKREEEWSNDEQGAPVTFATAAPATSPQGPAPAPRAQGSGNRPSPAEMGDFAKQLDAVRAKLFSGKARSGG